GRSRMQLVRRHADVLGEAAIGAGSRETATEEVDAAIRIAGAAVEADAARERRLHDDGRAGRPAGDAGSDLGDLARELVAHDEPGRPRVRAVAEPADVAA